MWKQEDCHKFLVSLSCTVTGQAWGCIVRCLSKQKNKQNKGTGGEKEGEKERENLTHKDYQCGLRHLSSDLCRVREGFLPRLKEKRPDLYKHIMLCYGSLCVSIAKDLWSGNSQSLGSCVFIDNTFSSSLCSWVQTTAQ